MTRIPGILRSQGKLDWSYAPTLIKWKSFCWKKILDLILIFGILNQLYFKHDHSRTDRQNCPPKEWSNDILVDCIVFVDKTINNQIAKNIGKIESFWFNLLLNCLASEYIWMMVQKRCFRAESSGVDFLLQSNKGKSVVMSLAMQTNSQHEQMKKEIDVTPDMIAA